MTLKEFIKIHDVDYSYNRVNESFLSEMERVLGVKIGKQLKDYIISYGYLGYEYVELFGVNNSQLTNSDMIKRTVFLHEKFESTRGLIALEDQGDGDFYLVDCQDMVYRFAVGSNKLTKTNLTLEEYILDRFSKV